MSRHNVHLETASNSVIINADGSLGRGTKCTVSEKRSQYGTTVFPLKGGRAVMKSIADVNRDFLGPVKSEGDPQEVDGMIFLWSKRYRQGKPFQVLNHLWPPDLAAAQALICG